MSVSVCKRMCLCEKEIAYFLLVSSFLSINQLFFKVNYFISSVKSVHKNMTMHSCKKKLLLFAGNMDLGLFQGYAGVFFQSLF